MQSHKFGCELSYYLLAPVNFQRYERVYRLHLFSCHAAGAEPHYLRIRMGLNVASMSPQRRCSEVFCSLTHFLGQVGALVAACLTMVEHQRVRQNTKSKQMRDLQET